jgi:hypothetical protein
LATVLAGATLSSQYILTNAGTTVSASQGPCSYDSTAKVATCTLGSISVPGNGGMASAIGAISSTIAQSAQLANGTPNLAHTACATISSAPPPAVSGTSNLTAGFGKSGTEAFTIAGTGTLTLTATSSNTTLLSNANISGAPSCMTVGSCTLTLTPATGQSGTATVTITVTDSYAQSRSGTFTFTVNAAPPPPSGGGGGGGGALGLWSLLGLLGLALLRPVPAERSRLVPSSQSRLGRIFHRPRRWRHIFGNRPSLRSLRGA